jgi:hypothetical protein
MYSYFGDVIWSNGRDGGYLVLGNMVYTVRFLSLIVFNIYMFNVFLIIIVRRGNSVPKSRPNNKLVDMDDSLFHLGIYCTMVLFYGILCKHLAHCESRSCIFRNPPHDIYVTRFLAMLNINPRHDTPSRCSSQSVSLIL